MGSQSGAWTKEKLKQYGINAFYYFALIDNFESILDHGILPENEVKNRKLLYKSFANVEVQSRRDAKGILLTDGQRYNIHDLVPLYLTPKTPTLSACRVQNDKIFFAVIQSFVILDNEIAFAFSDGNAANRKTRFYCNPDDLDKISWDAIKAKYWKDFTDGVRKRNAEFLLRPRVPVQRIWRFVVFNQENKNLLESILRKRSLNFTVKINLSFFF